MRFQGFPVLYPSLQLALLHYLLGFQKHVLRGYTLDHAVCLVNQRLGSSFSLSLEF